MGHVVEVTLLFKANVNLYRQECIIISALTLDKVSARLACFAVKRCVRPAAVTREYRLVPTLHRPIIDQYRPRHQYRYIAVYRL